LTRPGQPEVLVQPWIEEKLTKSKGINRNKIKV
jgi:hypothetical protein